MPESKITGYKKVFGFVLPEWVDEKSLNMAIGYVLVSMVMMFVLVLLVNPNKETVNKLQAQYKTDSQRLTALTESKRNMDKLLQDVTKTEQDAIFKAMPINYSPEEAIYSIRLVANESQVSIKEYTLPRGTLFEEGKLQFGGSGSKDKTNSVIFNNFILTVSIDGNIENILKFVRAIQKTLPVAFVSDLGIQEAVKMAESTKSRSVTLKLSIVYYQPVVKSFNLAGLQTFSSAETTLMKELATYNTQSSTGYVPSASISGELSGDSSRDLFGE